MAAAASTEVEHATVVPTEALDIGAAMPAVVE